MSTKTTKITVVKPPPRKANQPKQKLNRQNNKPRYRKYFDPMAMTKIQDKHDGTLNKQLNKQLIPMSAEQKTIAMSILNPGHQDNSSNAIGTCSNGTGRIFVSKCVQQYTIDLPVGTTEICFYNLPFPEYPFGFTLKGVDANPNTTYFYVIPNQSFVEQGASGAEDTWFVEGYLKHMGVYGIMPIGTSQTIECVQANMFKKGRVGTARKTCDIDLSQLDVDGGSQDTVAAQNIFTLQNLPTTMAQVSRLQGTFDNRDVTAGAYLVSHHTSYNTFYRDTPYHKNGDYADSPNGDPANPLSSHKNILQVTDLAGGHYYARQWRPETGFDTVKPAAVTGVMPLDMPMACFTGLTSTAEAPTSFSIKACVTYQFELKAGSPLLQYSVPRPMYDPDFLDYILKFESAITVGGYPASYNFWDKVWPIFKQLWRSGGGKLVRKIPKAGGTIGDIGDLIIDSF